MAGFGSSTEGAEAGNSAGASAGASRQPSTGAAYSGWGGDAPVGSGIGKI